MEPHELCELYTQHKNTTIIAEKLSETSTIKLQLKNLLGSAFSMFTAASWSILNKNGNQNFFLCILPDKETSAYFFNDLTNVLNDENVLFFPSSYKRSAQYHSIDGSNMLLRTDVLNQIKQSQNNKTFPIIVSYPEALSEKVITLKKLEANTLPLHVKEEISIDFIVEVLNEYEFEKVDFVYDPGQYSVRGSIVDIFSFSNEYPYRVDFFGDEIETIRTFNTSTQLSLTKYEKIDLIPDIQTKLTEEARISFFEFIPTTTKLWISDTKYLIDRIRVIYKNTSTKYYETSEEERSEKALSPPEFLINGNKLTETLDKFTIIEIGSQPFFNSNFSFEFKTSLQPDFNKNFEILSHNLFEKTDLGYKNIILSENEKQIDRLKSILEAEKMGKAIEFEPLLTTIHQGFIDHDLKICCYTDHQIFQRYHKFNLKKAAGYLEGREKLSLQEINNLHPGDYVVHVDHGIGKFGGLTKTNINGLMQEVIQLIYDGNDVLFVSINSLHRISKYKGKDGAPTKVYKLGSGTWHKLKQKTKSKVKDIAKELIALYAKRKKEHGFEFSQDSYLQFELESSFIYEDTPDQIKATAAAKKDMESSTPMDRLVCGDVGFGKTEIAIRAAFKAVADSKQVAVLVPTTILALQHYKTFSERLKELPCNVDYISRLKSVKDQKETIKNVEAGKTDILIGTHRIVGKDVNFKDLGLLIIDEEQKFGVSIKEKLKRFKLNVDTLTLTATPIPRTLQFSLMGARDLSIINTPPPNRYPIMTELHTFNEDIIREAINYEVTRNGQVFFINNRVQNINEVAALIERLTPDVKTIVAHGQMKGPELEKIMLAFIKGEYDVLVATTIIESGLDIPNANTIIINNAQNFGLSDLHQLRGRVGRSNKKAFCYLLAPPLTMVSQESRRRLKAIEDFSELGSGFNIALQDLDIRGAGNMLGGEQSGFIADIGFDTYHRILDEALLELRENEFKDKNIELENQIQASNFLAASQGKKNPINSDIIKFITDCQIDTDIEMLFPDDYINNISERLRLYRELDNLQNKEELQEFEERLIDRFGKPPKQSKDLLKTLNVRWLAIDLGFEKIIIKQQKMICLFVSNQESAYYSSAIFSNIVKYIQDIPKKCELKQKVNKLTLVFKKISNINHAIKCLADMHEKIFKKTDKS